MVISDGMHSSYVNQMEYSWKGQSTIIPKDYKDVAMEIMETGPSYNGDMLEKGS